MPECVICGEPLPTPLATYGDWEYPVCQSCWLTNPGAEWDLEIFTHHPLPDGGWTIRKGRDYDSFFEVSHAR